MHLPSRIADKIMARQLFKQPNGLYAAFSTAEEVFVIRDATAKELIEHSRQEAADEADRRCREALAAADSGTPLGILACTWDRAVELHNRNSRPNDCV